MRRMAAIAACALAFVAPLVWCDAPAAAHQRALCVAFRCTTIAQNAHLRIVRVAARNPEVEDGFSLHYAIWKPLGRVTPLGDVNGDEGGLQRLALTSRFVGYVTSFCSHETLECAYAVFRMNAQAGRREAVPLPDTDLGVGEAPQPWAVCGDQSRRVTGLVVTSAGTVAWAKEAAVCELPHGSQIPIVVANSTTLDKYSLRLAHGRLSWRDGETVRRVPMS